MCRLKDLKLTTDHAIQLAAFRDLRDPLVIESGSITHFSRALYHKLPNVTDLTIDRLAIERLYVSPHLVHLSAVGNAIETLLLEETAGDNESAITPTIQYSMMTLHLSSNKLTELPRFDRFVRLMTLALDHNQLTTVDMGAFVNLRELRVLSLANNRLLTVTTTVGTTKSSPLQLLKLKRLSFSGNELDVLDVHKWEFDSLNVLNLTQNSLTRIEGNISQFPALTRLELADNRWYCEWLAGGSKQLNDKTITLDRDEPGRCREANMLTSGRYCCNPVGIDGAVSVDSFGDQWDELRRLEQLLEKLNSTIANGSASVRPMLEAQHKGLTERIDALVAAQEQQARELTSLDDGIDRHGADLRQTERELNSMVDRLSRLVNGRWNHTLMRGSGSNDDDDDDDLAETLLNVTTNGPSSTAGNWPQLAAQNERNLRRLSHKLETSNKQFNEYMSKSYEHGATLKAQAERIDTLQGGLNDVKQYGKRLETRLDNVERIANTVYDYLDRLEQRSGEEFQRIAPFPYGGTD